MRNPPPIGVSWKQHELACPCGTKMLTGRGFCPLRPRKGTTSACHGSPHMNRTTSPQSFPLLYCCFVCRPYRYYVRICNQLKSAALPVRGMHTNHLHTQHRRQRLLSAQQNAEGVLRPCWSRMVFRTQFPPVTCAYVLPGRPFTVWREAAGYNLMSTGVVPLRPSGAIAPANLHY